jgi:hypothetical protein
MIDVLHSDAIVSWLGGAGCLAYCAFAWAHRAGDPRTRVELVLFGILAAFLALRAAWWLHRDARLGTLVFALATLLPLALTLYCEHVLRRHHPLWLKLFAAATSAGFFMLNAFGGLHGSTAALVAFLGCVVVTLGANGVLLARERSDDSASRSISGALLLAAMMAVPLAVTDFREEVPGIPMRLGGLGPLVLVYCLLGADAAARPRQSRLVRLAGLALSAVAMAVAFAWIGGRLQVDAVLMLLPMCLAWVLLSAVLTRMDAMRAEARSGSFLRWLLHARLDSLDGFIASVRRLSFARSCVVLGESELSGYDVAAWASLPQAGRAVLSLSDARVALRAGDALDANEQLVDVLERHEMTHALLVESQPPRVILLHLGQAADRYAAETQAAVVQRLARFVAQPA